jgi:hypothetical protein
MWAMMQKLRMCFINGSCTAKLHLKRFVWSDVPLLILCGGSMYYIYKLPEREFVENATLLAFLLF